MSGDKFKVGPNKERRLTRVSLVVPICIGNISETLDTKADTKGASHRWSMYVRAPDNSDLAHVISKVSFTLHQSFAVPLRELTAAPYEVHEEGWGEFDVAIKIEFSPDAMEPPLKLSHRLKLFHDEEAKLKDPKRRPVVKEVYDEIIFWEPTDAFYERVKHTRVKKVTEQPNPLLPVYREQQELQHLLSARTIVAQERASMEQLGAQGL